MWSNITTQKLYRLSWYVKLLLQLHCPVTTLKLAPTLHETGMNTVPILVHHRLMGSPQESVVCSLPCHISHPQESLPPIRVFRMVQIFVAQQFVPSVWASSGTMLENVHWSCYEMVPKQGAIETNKGTSSILQGLFCALTGNAHVAAQHLVITTSAPVVES